MTFGIFIIALWITVGSLTIGEAILSKTYKVSMPSYLICLIMLIGELIFDYILKM